MDRSLETRPDDDGNATVIMDATSDGSTPGVPEHVELADSGVIAAIGRYQVFGRIGAGAMGRVYEGYDASLDRRVAIKVLRRKLARGKEAVARMEREAQSLAKLSHSNVVQVYEVGRHEGATFVAMEFVEGVTLREWLDRETRDWREVLAMLIQTGRGLAAAHDVGLVHRDFKPQNVLVGNDGVPKVVDFGLAKRERQPGEELSEFSVDEADDYSQRHSLDLELTRAGTALGTPAYMPPEQHFGTETSHSSDQFSFCVTLWEGLYGQRPFTGKDLRELSRNVARGNIVEPDRPGSVPKWLRRILTRGLSADPSKRWPSMHALLDALSKDPVQARRRVLGLGMAAVLVAGISYGAASYRGAAVETCSATAGAGETLWSESLATEIRQAFEATEVPFASDTATRVTSRLELLAETWSRLRVETCDGLRRDEISDALHDLRVRCLDERLDHYRARIDLFLEADAQVVKEAIPLLETAPSLDGCEDPAYLQARVEPPANPQLAQTVKAYRAELATYDAMIEAVRPGALEGTQAILERLDGIDYPPLEAEVRYTLGKGYLRIGRPQEANDNLQQAYHLALSSGHDEIAAKAAAVLVSAYVEMMGQYEQARIWMPHARSVLARTNDLREPAMLLANAEGAYHHRTGDNATAIADWQRALQLSLSADGAPTAASGQFLNNLCQTYIDESRLDEAEPLCEQALEVIARELGEKHPRYALPWTGLGNLAFVRGELDKGVEYHERALAIARPALGADHPEVSALVFNYGTSLRKAGRLEQALAVLQEVLETREKLLGEDNPRLATPLNNIAELQRLLGDAPAAVRSSRRALELQEAALGPDNPMLCYFLSGLGLSLLDAGDEDAAIAAFSRALSIPGIDRLPVELMGEIKFGLARARVQRSGSDAALADDASLAFAAEALASYRSSSGADKHTVEEIERWLEAHGGAPLAVKTAEPPTRDG